MPKAIPKNNNGRPVGGRKRQLDTEEVSSSPSRPVRPRIVVQHRPPEVGTQHRASPSQRSSVVSSTTSPREPSPSAGGTSNFLLEALRRIRELQDELDFLQNDPYAEDTDDEEDDNDDYGQEADQREQGTIGGQQAEAIGWAVCAQETMHFLQREGIPADSPLLVNLRRRLIGNHGDGSGLLDEGLSC